jgi:hypothetical protein
VEARIGEREGELEPGGGLPETLYPTLHPTPYTLIYTLHPTPYSTPCTLHPTLHPTPHTLHPSPYSTPYTLHPTLHPIPYTLRVGEREGEREPGPAFGVQGYGLKGLGVGCGV